MTPPFLSDRLKRLVDLFAPTAMTVRLTPDDIATMRAVFVGLREQALEIENEISRRRCNEAARHDRETRAVIDALFEPAPSGGNVVLFPDQRPAFDDGRGEPTEWR